MTFSFSKKQYIRLTTKLFCFVIFLFSINGFSIKTDAPNCMTSQCHTSINALKFKHGPVKEKGCTVCHMIEDKNTAQPTQNNTDLPAHHPHLKPIPTSKINEACWTCHEDKKLEDHIVIHKAITEKSCTSCHSPHGGNQKYNLKYEKIEDLCLSCHKEVKDAPHGKHAQILSKPKSCLQCHVPHFSQNKKLLKESRTDQLCFQCHDNFAKAKLTAKTVHKVVDEGKCESCHTPHGTADNFFLKKPYEENNPSLCFECHKKSLQTQPEVSATSGEFTQFHNGNVNLHAFHLNLKNSQSQNCRICHEVHMSSQPRLIRNYMNMFDWKLPIEYIKNENGGSCVSACHKLKSYNRIQKIQNEQGR